MRFKKILAGIAAGAMVVSSLVVPTLAEETIEGTLTYDVSYNWFDSTDEWGQVWFQDWSKSVTVEGAYVTLTDGTTVDVAYDNSYGSYIIVIIGDNAVVDDYTTVASVTYEVAYDADAYNDDEAWIGGGIGVNSSSTGWSTVEWGKASGEKTIAIEDTAAVAEEDAGTSSNDPDASSNDPDTSTNDPDTSSNDPDTSSNDPGTSSNDPDATEDYVLGDVNQDGEIDYLDAMTVLRYDAELIDLSETQRAAGDTNGDGYVDSLDAILILRYDADLISSFES